MASTECQEYVVHTQYVLCSYLTCQLCTHCLKLRPKFVLILSRQTSVSASDLLFLWLFPSCRVAGMTDDLSSPHRPVRLLARSQSSRPTFQIPSTRDFPSCFRSSSLPFPWYICPHHFLSVIFLEACATLVVPRMCSFLSCLCVSLRTSIGLSFRQWVQS